MAGRLNNIISFIAHYKYLITIVVGFLIVGVLDDNSFRKLVEYQFQISDMKESIRKYDSQYLRDSRLLWQIDRNPKAIEKVAREKYFMKADDEDIFVLSDDAGVNQVDDNNVDEQDEAAK
jgi:hypothetical protein